MAKDYDLSTKAWNFYRGRGRRRRKPATIALMMLATVLVIGGVVAAVFIVAVRHAWHSSVNVGDDRMFVPTN